MGTPAAKMGDRIISNDMHIVMIPSPAGPISTPLPHPFMGIINSNLSQNVMVMGKPAATVGSTASNMPPHIPQGGPFSRPPSNRGTIIMGSATVRINGKMASRNGDIAMTCDDPSDMPVGKVIASGTVFIG